MPDKRTIESWGNKLNLPDEPLDMSEAMLLNLGHLNARMEVLLTTLQDMSNRLARLEIWIARAYPDYDDYAREAIYKALQARVPVTNWEYTHVE